MVTALAVLSVVLALTLAGLAAARMQSTKLRPGLCETTGGGRFVDIPGFPGETIDRRLLTDIRRLVRLRADVAIHLVAARVLHRVELR